MRDNLVRKGAPSVMWTLVLLNVLIFVWDRQGGLFGPSIVFSDLAIRPREVVAVATGGDRFALVTMFTSMFLHASMLHLVGNLIFLVVFGPSVEEALGTWRFALYYVAWGVAAAAAQIYVDPTSGTPIVGASGAIGGVLGAYFLLYPGAQIQVMVPLAPFWRPALAAWILLGLWFLWQIVVPQEGVATWSHAGGFLAGMLTVLIMGGRQAVLDARRDQDAIVP